MNLDGKVAVVTGGTGGLGTVVCRTLAHAGARVVIVYRQSADAARQLAEELTATDAPAIALQADVTSAAEVQALMRNAFERWGRLDVLVNDAAVNAWVPFSDLEGLTDEIWSEILGTNLIGPFTCARAAAAHMRRASGGRIINVASVAGLSPGGSSIAYAVAKAGLIHLTRCLAVALAPDILVNCVAPGLLEGTRSTSGLAPEYAQSARERSLLKRAASKHDVADQVLAFARSDTTTGQTVVIDSGRVFH